MNARCSLFLFVAAVFTLTAAAQQDQPREYPSIQNFLRVNEQICTGGQPSADDLAKLKAEGINPQNRPAFIHCRSANRVGAFWMIRRVLADGWKVEDSEAEARKIGLHSPNLIEFARSYIERHAKKSS